VLASYWYPKLNTDVVDMTGQTKWPTPETEKDIIKELKGMTVENPVVVIRGTPYGKKLFNVYLVDVAPSAAAPSAAAATPAQASIGPVVLDATVSKNFKDNTTRFEMEIKTNGDYPVWAKKDEAFRASFLSYVKALPTAQMGIKGKDNWLFFRGEAAYLNSGDMSLQAPDKNPIPQLVEFAKFLKSKNISLIFVPVPNKSDVYFEKLPVDNPPKDLYEFVHPYARKMLKDMQAAGIEVIDLLPAFLEAKKEDAKNKEAVYQKHDTHWTDRGLEAAAKLIADRVKQFAWYGEVPKVKYTVKDTTFSRQGDIVDKLAEADKASFNAVDIAARRVYNPDGTAFKGANVDAPVMLIGDSFTGVFELVDCKAAGVGAHIAANTGIPVDIITSWGGGPLVRDKFYRARKNNLDKKRVVIYMMVSRDLYNYSQLWQPLETK
jgi:alginate O-acetyltransferase complex protein AlgJ